MRPARYLQIDPDVPSDLLGPPEPRVGHLQGHGDLRTLLPDGARACGQLPALLLPGQRPGEHDAGLPRRDTGRRRDLRGQQQHAASALPPPLGGEYHRPPDIEASEQTAARFIAIVSPHAPMASSPSGFCTWNSEAI